MEAQHSVPRGDSPVTTLYTVGHGNRSAEEFLEILSSSGIGCLVDVRAYPSSRRHPQFSQTRLAPILNQIGIHYDWRGKALGGFRQGSSSSIHTALTSDSLRAYAEYMSSTAFQDGITELLLSCRQTSIAMLCAERLPEHCHRALLADYLTAIGISVKHILEKDEIVLHHLSRLARWEQGRLIYDQVDNKQMGWSF